MRNHTPKYGELRYRIKRKKLWWTCSYEPKLFDIKIQSAALWYLLFNYLARYTCIIRIVLCARSTLHDHRSIFHCHRVYFHFALKSLAIASFPRRLRCQALHVIPYPLHRRWPHMGETGSPGSSESATARLGR